MKSKSSKSAWFWAFALSIGGGLGLAGCGKSIEVYGKVKNVIVPKGPNCQDESERLTWRWNQPTPTFSKSVDLLFVTDTSLSVVDERRALAKAIPGFL